MQTSQTGQSWDPLHSSNGSIFLAFKRIHDQPEALVGFAHFSRNGCNLPRGFPWYVNTEAIDFVELLQFNTINALDYYAYLNLGFRLTAAAGSDVPWGSTKGESGTPDLRLGISICGSTSRYFWRTAQPRNTLICRR